MAEILKKNNVGTVPQMASAGVILDGKYLPPPTDGDGKLWVRTNALIHAGQYELYERWRNLERVPAWQEQIERVTITGERTSHWVMRSAVSSARLMY